jgi:acyl transferase domain-containing protein
MAAAMIESNRVLAPRRPQPVAIVGIGCRSPGASGLGAFWQLLAEARNAIGRILASRPDAEALDALPAAAGELGRDVPAGSRKKIEL